MWPLIVGGALLGGGTAASTIGNNEALKAGNKVLRKEGARQRGYDSQLQKSTDQLLIASNPAVAMGDELRTGGNNAAELNTVAGNIQAGATAAGGAPLTAGRSNRVSASARNLARARAARKKRDDKDQTKSQFVLDRSRIQQDSQNSQAIAAIEAQDASRAGSGWRTVGGVMQGGAMLSMLA